MADGVELNAGSGGATAATDDCGVAGHAQIVKLAISTDGSATPIPADGTNGLDVDVTRVIPGTTATALGKAEDAAHASGDTGVMALAVRQDTATQLAGTDGDYSPLITDSSGRLHVTGPVTDGGGSLTVDNGGTFAVQAAQSGTWNINNVSGTVSLPTGAATAAKQPALGTAGSASTDVITIQGIAAMTPLLSAQSGTWTVQIGNTANTTPILASIHDGTTKASVADLTNSNPLHVALVDTNGDQVSSFGGGTQYTEDAAAAANPVGNAQILVRADTPAGVASADGDNVAQRGTNFGAAFVQVCDSSGNFIDTFGGSGGTAIADGAAFTRNTTQITPAGAAVESSAPTLTDGDVAALSMTTGGALRVAVTTGGIAGVMEDAASAGGEEGPLAMAVRQDTLASNTSADGDFTYLKTTSAGRLYTSATIDAALPAGTNAIGKLAANSGVTIGAVEIAAAQTLATVTNVATIGTSVTPGTAAANLGKAEDAAHASGDVGVMALSVRQNTATATSGTDGDYQPLITDTNGRLHVITGPSTGTIEVVGDVADDAATGGNPVLVAGVAVETDGTDPTTVSAEGDAAYLRTDRARRLLVSEHHPRGFFVSADYATAQTNASVKAAPGASLSLYITDIVISNGATAGNITLLDGSGGTVVFEIYPAINGGCTISLRNPIRLTANTALCITSTTVTTHSVNIGGYIAP